MMMICCVQLLEELLAAGADANRKRLSLRGETALHVARTGRAAQLLLASEGRYLSPLKPPHWCHSRGVLN